ncbi:MAG: Tim44/TimA family putative adaptor protein [Rickettsiales bacterium]|nr:Tim44/TimA family putative adaptor protein [Rickettsiales bacterium]
MTYILILAVIAIVLAIKLFSIFGQKKYIRKNQFDHRQRNANCATTKSSQVVPLKNVELNLDKVKDPINRLKILAPSFNIKTFLKEAKNSYKRILKFYAEGDTHSLSDLINIEMMRKFAYKITQREEASLKCDINILKIKDAVIEKISFEKDIVALLQVVFKSEVIHYITNKNNKITTGNKTKIDNRKDIWTFSKNLRSLDSSWKLVDINQLL